MTINPIDAALMELKSLGVPVFRREVQAAIEAYEAAWVHSASQDALRALAEQAQAAGLYESASTDLPNPHPPVSSPQTSQTACGKTWWEQADAGMRAAVLAHVPVKNEFVANLRAQYAERGLTGDEGGE